jgi:transposase
VYWKPVYNVLEQREELTLLVINAQHLKTVPGRKTDVKDAEWIANLLRHGRLRASFIPDRHQRELRELVRYRTALIHQRAAEVNRLQNTLEGANIKLAAVLSDVTGVSGQPSPVFVAHIAARSGRRLDRVLEPALDELRQRLARRDNDGRTRDGNIRGRGLFGIEDQSGIFLLWLFAADSMPCPGGARQAFTMPLES